MEKISKPELVEILKSYGLYNLIFDFFRQVEPDTAIYVFHDEENIQYCLVAADYLSDDTKMPYFFEYNYYSNAVVKFRAIKQLSYIENAPKKPLDISMTKNIGQRLVRVMFACYMLSMI